MSVERRASVTHMPLQLKSLLAPQTSLLSRSLNNKIIMSLFPRVKQKCTGSAGRCWDRSCWLLFMCTNLRNCSLKLKLKSPQIFLQSRLQYFPKPIAKSADSDVHFISFQNLHWTEFFTNRSRRQNPPPPPPSFALTKHTHTKLWNLLTLLSGHCLWAFATSFCFSRSLCPSSWRLCWVLCGKGHSSTLVEREVEG